MRERINKDGTMRVLLVVLILLTLVSIGLNLFHKTNNVDIEKSISERIAQIKIPVPANGKDAQVDYKSIQEYIDSRIPAPIQGPPGIPGLQGDQGNMGVPGLSIKGEAGSSCSAQQLEDGAAIVCTDGTSAIIHDGATGPQGEPGKDAYIELRCNEKKNRWEVRYMPDASWELLNNQVTPCKPGVV